VIFGLQVAVERKVALCDLQLFVNLPREYGEQQEIVRGIKAADGSVIESSANSAAEWLL
jgi:hypothetical protein